MLFVIDATLCAFHAVLFASVIAWCLGLETVGELYGFALDRAFPSLCCASDDCPGPLSRVEDICPGGDVEVARHEPIQIATCTGSGEPSPADSVLVHTVPSLKELCDRAAEKISMPDHVDQLEQDPVPQEPVSQDSVFESVDASVEQVFEPQVLTEVAALDSPVTFCTGDIKDTDFGELTILNPMDFDFDEAPINVLQELGLDEVHISNPQDLDLDEVFANALQELGLDGVHISNPQEDLDLDKVLTDDPMDLGFDGADISIPMELDSVEEVITEDLVDTDMVSEPTDVNPGDWNWDVTSKGAIFTPWPELAACSVVRPAVLVDWEDGILEEVRVDDDSDSANDGDGAIDLLADVLDFSGEGGQQVVPNEPHGVKTDDEEVFASYDSQYSGVDGESSFAPLADVLNLLSEGRQQIDAQEPQRSEAVGEGYLDFLAEDFDYSNQGGFSWDAEEPQIAETSVDAMTDESYAEMVQSMLANVLGGSDGED